LRLTARGHLQRCQRQARRHRRGQGRDHRRRQLHAANDRFDATIGFPAPRPTWASAQGPPPAGRKGWASTPTSARPWARDGGHLGVGESGAGAHHRRRRGGRGGSAAEKRPRSASSRRVGMGVDYRF
jgi:hypothetical protein